MLSCTSTPLPTFNMYATSRQKQPCTHALQYRNVSPIARSTPVRLALRLHAARGQQILVADIRPPSVRLADLWHIGCNHLADSRCILMSELLLGINERETIPCRVIALFVMRSTLKDVAIGWQDQSPANFIELECKARC